MNREGAPVPGNEARFALAVDTLKRHQKTYTRPNWIRDEGNPWTSGAFNPDAFDPEAPYTPRGEVYVLESNPTRLLENPFDLDNLRFIDKEKVKTFLGDLEDLTESQPEKGVVAMIGTGGTIAMHKNEKDELVTGLDPDYLLDQTGGTRSKYAVASMEFPTPIDSSQQEIDYNADLVIAMSYVWKNASEKLKEKLNGFLIAHGTDTMAGSSSYVAMMLGPECPFSVGFVGSQKPINEKYTDARINLENAFTALEDLKEARMPERFVCMGGSAGGAYLAVAVQKESDQLAQAFGSPTHPLLIKVSNFASEGISNSFHRLYLERKLGTLRIPKDQDMNTDFLPIIMRGYSPFIRLKPEMGDNPRFYYDLIKNDSRAKAVLLTTFGSFTANTKLRDAILQASRESEKTIFAANPFPGGSDAHEYKISKELRESGVNVTAILPTALGAKISLAYHLFGDDMNMISRFVANNNYVGEQPPDYWHLRGEGLPIGRRSIWMKTIHQGKIPQ